MSIAQNNPEEFEDFEFMISLFQIKISLVGYNQPYIPRVKDYCSSMINEDY